MLSWSGLRDLLLKGHVYSLTSALLCAVSRKNENVHGHSLICHKIATLMESRAFLLYTLHIQGTAIPSFTGQHPQTEVGCHDLGVFFCPEPAHPVPSTWGSVLPESSGKNPWLGLTLPLEELPQIVSRAMITVGSLQCTFIF